MNFSDNNPVSTYCGTVSTNRGYQMSQKGIFGSLKANYANNYVLTRGAQDFGNLSQYNMYEKGYPFLVIVRAPECLTKLKELDIVGNQYESMVNAFLHILEYEFKGLDGLEGINSETQEINDGINTLEVITKVTMQSASTFSMRYNEKAGSLITRVCELYLRGLRDPRTGFKHYNGLIPDEIPDPGFEKECFSFLYFTTDNTGLAIEKAFYIVSAQITSSDQTIYNSEKGQVEFAEVSVEFRGFPITGAAVNRQAVKVLKYINDPNAAFNVRLHKDSADFKYTDNGNDLTEYSEDGSVNTESDSTSNIEQYPNFKTT